MSTQNRISDAELRSLLQDETTLILGITRFHEDYLDEIACHVKRYSRVVPHAHDLAVVAHDAIAVLFEKVRNTGFVPDHPFLYVKRIALNLAFNITCGEPQTAQLEDLTGISSPVTSDPVAMGEFWDCLEEAIRILPQMQGLVAAGYCDYVREFGRKPAFEELAAIVSETCQSSVSISAVKSAWQEAKRKLRDELARRGYDGFA